MVRRLYSVPGCARLALVRAPWRRSRQSLQRVQWKQTLGLYVRLSVRPFRQGSAGFRRLRSTRKGISEGLSAQKRQNLSSSSSI